MDKAYSTQRVFSLFIMLTTLGLISALLLNQIVPSTSILDQIVPSDIKIVVTASPDRRYQIPSGTNSKQSFFIDDITVYDGKEVVFSDAFDSYSLGENGWRAINNATREGNYSYSPSYSLVLRQSGQAVAHAYHRINIGSEWQTVSYTAFVMISDLKPEYGGRHTNLVLYSGSSNCNLAGGVIVDYTGKAHVWLYINYFEDNRPSERTRNYNITLESFRWYGVSLVVSKPSKQVELYIDGDLVVQVPLDVSYFQTFDDISVWGWIP